MRCRWDRAPYGGNTIPILATSKFQSPYVVGTEIGTPQKLARKIQLWIVSLTSESETNLRKKQKIRKTENLTVKENQTTKDKKIPLRKRPKTGQQRYYYNENIKQVIRKLIKGEPKNA